MPIKSSLWRYGWLALIVAPIAYLGYYAQLNHAGYCFKDGRSRSDKEKIASAVQYVVSQEQARDVFKQIDGNLVLLQPQQEGSEQKLIVPYKSAEDFMRVNPSCCELTERASEGFQHDWITRWSGDASTFVRIKYLRRYRGETGPERSELLETYVTITNCGKPW